MQHKDRQRRVARCRACKHMVRDNHFPRCHRYKTKMGTSLRRLERLARYVAPGFAPYGIAALIWALILIFVAVHN